MLYLETKEVIYERKNNNQFLNNTAHLEKISLMDKEGNPVDIEVEVPESPMPQKIAEGSLLVNSVSVILVLLIIIEIVFIAV